MEKTAESVQSTLALIVEIANLNPHMRLFLSYRACGFSLREACTLSHISESTVRRWRQENSNFAAIESPENVAELTEKFAYKFLELEFLRNFRLVLRKDYEVIMGSLDYPDGLSKEDNQYLLRLRSQYTPEQLDVVRKLVEAGGLEEFNFTQLVLQFGEQQLRITDGQGRKTFRN